MNAMPMNALGTFDPRDAMERWTQQTQNAQQNALLPGGGGSISMLPQPMPILMPPPAANGPPMMPPPMAGMQPLPFGGYRANGGPVQPGRAYVVGERGPELMVPQVPGTIVPNAATRPMPVNPLDQYVSRINAATRPMPVNPLDQHVSRINAAHDQSLASVRDFWNESAQNSKNASEQSKQNALQAQQNRNRFQSGSPEWQSANDAVNKNVANYKTELKSQQDALKKAAYEGGWIGLKQGWDKVERIDAYSQQKAEAVMAEMRAKRGSQPPANVTPASSSTPAAATPTGGPGMLVAGPGGSVVWQRGTGPGTTLPPQTTPAAPTQSTSMPMMRPANNSRIAQSPSNRPYAELAGGTGSLANRGTRPVGRSANDPGRMNDMAMRRLRSQGDIVGAARLANSNAWLDARLGGPAMRAPQPMPMMMPPQPSANRAPMPMPGTPGQSLPAPEMPMPDAGATADAAAPAAPPPMDAPPMSFEQAFNQSPLAGAGLPPMNQAMPPMQVPAGTFAQMPGLNQGAFKGAYVEAPPLVGSAPIPGTDQMQPMVKGEPKGAPVNRTQPPKPAAWEAPKMYDETIPEVRDANGNVTQPARTRQYYFVQDPQTGKPRKEYALDANGDGVPDNAPGQQPGWMGWLQSQK